MLDNRSSCSTNQLEVAGQMRNIYLAGPEVFLLNAREIGEQKKAICQKYGLNGIFPLDNELRPKNASLSARAIAIYRANVDLIRNSDAIIANLTPFRGPSMDVGTAFEIGFAAALGLPVFGYTNSPARLIERVSSSIQTTLAERHASPVDERGMEIENFGFFENLMIEVPVLETAGSIVSGTTSESERFTDLTVFENCIDRLAKNLSNSGLHRQRA
jgi:nucleoside 2-deoxyribosyltransferase